jgi:hypothetical protein
VVAVLLLISPIAARAQVDTSRMAGVIVDESGRCASRRHCHGYQSGDAAGSGDGDKRIRSLPGHGIAAKVSAVQEAMTVTGQAPIIKSTGAD